MQDCDLTKSLGELHMGYLPDVGFFAVTGSGEVPVWMGSYGTGVNRIPTETDEEQNSNLQDMHHAFWFQY